MIPPSPTSTLFPYTTLFRSQRHLIVGNLPCQRTENVKCEENRKHHANSGERQRPRSLRRDIEDRKSTRLNSSHVEISYAVFCLKKKKDETYPEEGSEKTELF